MKVEQAIYGEVRSGHALRVSSERGRLSSELTSRMDLPDTAPPNADWSPFLSGFPHGDRYVLARTFSDSTATRAGMVLSHAVIASLNEVSSTADLRPLLALLLTSPKAPVTVESCEVSVSTERPAAAIDLVATAEALTSRGTGPVVRIGNQGLEDLVVSLWFHLWPELRASFAFRLSFGPQDLVDVAKPSLVCTPTALASRWAGYRIIGSTTPKTQSRAAAILSGGAGAEPVLGFAREIGARLDELASLSLLERAYELGLASTSNFDECVTVLRLVERLSPDPAAGALGKAKLVDKLIDRLPTASARDVLLLRNLGTRALPMANTIWAGVRAWAARNRFAESEDEQLLSAINDAISPATAIPAWREAILVGLADASRSASALFPAAFWRWAGAGPATLTALFEHLSIDRDLETRLADAVPRNLPHGAGDAVMGISLSKRWLHLHGAGAGASLDPHEAIRRQLCIDTEPANMHGVRAALRWATPDQTLDIAWETAEPRVLRITAEVVARMPQLLKDVDFHSAPAQQVWASALTINADAWQGPANPSQSFTVVLDNLIDGKQANADLICALSSSPVADLSDYPRRAEVWHRVGDMARSNLLRATAAGWLKHATSAAVPCTPDQHLEAVLLAGDSLDRALRALLQTDVGAAVRIVSVLPGFDETRFLRWLGEFAVLRYALPASDAEALGYLVLARRWQLAVNQVTFYARSGREDFKPALRICHTMLGAFTRWLLGQLPISSDEKWQVLEELAAELYPRGPDDNELWGRAGGWHADLESYGSGRARWRDAIGKIRRGKEPRPARLLGEMCRDYPSNDQLRYMAADPEFWGGYR